MQDIYRYIIDNSRDTRRSHLKLDTPCIEIGGGSLEFRGLLAHFVKTTIPRGKKIILCHACNNGKCSNVEHLYWGTPQDNAYDYLEANPDDTRLDRMRRKYGEDFTEMRRKIAQSAGIASSQSEKAKKKRIDNFKRYIDYFETVDTNDWGWKQKAAADLNVSHTQIVRMFKRYLAL